MLHNIFPENIVTALGWTVLHSLWQAFLVALLLAAYLLVWQKTDSQRRYLAGCLAMGSTLLFSLITFFVLLGNNGAGSASVSGVFSAGIEVPGHYFTENNPSVFAGYFNENMPLIVTAWLMGMVFFLLKTLGGLLYIQRLKTRHLSDVPKQWQAMMGNLCAPLGISQKIKLAASALVKVPMVVGWLKPVILMPVAAVNNLTTEQVEAILAHELAHIARYDFLVNILQAVVEAMFYFNPAVWWISTRIRTERENCCDDLAVATCGNSIAYAKALVSLQEMQQSQPMLALSFSKNKNELLCRIQRILKSPVKKSNAMEKISATVLLLAAVTMLSFQMKSSFSNAPETGENAYFSEEMAPGPAVVDTLPENALARANGNVKVVKKNGDVIDLVLDNGEIMDVKVNGKEVPEEDFDKYDLEKMPPDEIATIDVSKAATRRESRFPKGNFHYNSNDDGDEIEVRVKDGEIQYLRIDGEEIDEADYPGYEDMIEELVNDLPAPPPPPAAPFPPRAPRAPNAVPAPPAAPAPPAPPAPRTRTITTEKNGKGMTIIIENGHGEEPIEIEIENHRKGNVTINGNEIKGLKDGDRTVLKQDIEGGDEGRYFYDQARGRAFWFPDIPAIADAPFPEIAQMGAFTFPEAFDAPAFDEENQQLFNRLLDEQAARQHELFKRLEERQLLHRELSEEQQERMRQKMEAFEKFHLDRSEQLEKLEQMQLEKSRLLEELEKGKNGRARLFREDDHGALERDKRIQELFAMMEAKQKALAGLGQNGGFKPADIEKYSLEMKKLREAADRLENSSQLLLQERAKRALLNDGHGAQ